MCGSSLIIKDSTVHCKLDSKEGTYGIFHSQLHSMLIIRTVSRLQVAKINSQIKWANFDIIGYSLIADIEGTRMVSDLQQTTKDYPRQVDLFNHAPSNYYCLRFPLT